MIGIDELHDENLLKIRSKSVRIAYLYLVRTAERLEGYCCYPKRKGYFNDFRYYHGKKWLYAFIINKEKGLLFYLRPPARGHKAFNVEYLSKRYDDVSEAQSNHIQLRINNISDARRIMKDIFAYTDAQPARRPDAG